MPASKAGSKATVESLGEYAWKGLRVGSSRWIYGGAGIALRELRGRHKGRQWVIESDMMKLSAS